MRNAPVRQYLIFDLDGTLVDSCAVCVKILREMLIDRGSSHHIDPEFARPYMSRGGQAMVEALLGPACVAPAEDLAEFRSRYAMLQTPQSALFPGVAKSLRNLHAMGFTMAICSNKPQILCEQVLRDTGLAGLFDVVIGGQAELRPKPAPDLLDRTIALLGATASDCVYIGDSELDHEVAAVRGLPFMFLTYGYATNSWRPRDSECFECFPSLHDALVHRARNAAPLAQVG